MSATALPNFLCIGAQKSGTSWLHHTLKKHPEIWMPPVKELHYFDSSERLPLFLYLFQRTTSWNRNLATSGKRAWGVNSAWVMRFLLPFRTDRWYQSLFMPKAGQICGDVTPDYARVPTTMVAHINAMLPEAKIIYMLRDPIERNWSAFKMHQEKSCKGKADTISEEEIYQRFTKDFATYDLQTHYVEKLARWESYFPPKQILVTFYDELATNAADYIKKIWGYLDVTVDDKLIPANVNDPVGHRSSRPLPLQTRYWLTEQIYPQYKELHQRFNNQYTERWLANATATLNQGGNQGRN